MQTTLARASRRKSGCHGSGSSTRQTEHKACDRPRLAVSLAGLRSGFRWQPASPVLPAETTPHQQVRNGSRLPQLSAPRRL